MIRFSCPMCHMVLQADASQARLKMPCPRCGQRLQVPPPAVNKTVLGSLLPAGGPTRTAPAAAGPPPARAKAGSPATAPGRKGGPSRTLVLAAGIALLGVLGALIPLIHSEWNPPAVPADHQPVAPLVTNEKHRNHKEATEKAAADK